MQQRILTGKAESTTYKCSVCRVHAQLLHRVQLFVTPINYSLPGFSVHGILQARILEYIAISYSRGSSPAQGSKLCLVPPALAGSFFTTEPPGKQSTIVKTTSKEIPGNGDQKLVCLSFTDFPICVCGIYSYLYKIIIIYVCIIILSLYLLPIPQNSKRKILNTWNRIK